MPSYRRIAVLAGMPRARGNAHAPAYPHAGPDEPVPEGGWLAGVEGIEEDSRPESARGTSTPGRGF